MFSQSELDAMRALVTRCRAELLPHFSNSPAVMQPTAPFGTVAAPADYDGTNAAHFLDLTNLKPQSTGDDIAALCKKAIELGCPTVCINPTMLAVAQSNLSRSAVKAICVVGFPLGCSTAAAIAAETRLAVQAGAAEVDMVLSPGMMKAKLYNMAYEQITTVVAAAGKVPVKVILETCKLTDEEVVKASLIAAAAGAAFVKTSTGFSMDKLDDQPHTGATPQRVALMRLAVGDAVGVKASGGIKTAADADAVLKAGANRLGASGLQLDAGASY